MTEAMPAIGFGLMCKPPRPGTSKTRLAAGIGMQAAASLSAAFLIDCAEAAVEAGRHSPLQRVGFYRPADGATEIAAILGPGWPLEFADGGDLGATMRDVLSRLLQRCPSGAMIMGADVPLIGADAINEAADILRSGHDHTVVLVPSVDGGYCLIGIRSAEDASPLFEPMAWSTTGVLKETIRRARKARLELTVLRPQRDIDEEQDLVWLREAISQRPERAPATRRALASLWN